MATTDPELPATEDSSSLESMQIGTPTSIDMSLSSAKSNEYETSAGDSSFSDKHEPEGIQRRKKSSQDRREEQQRRQNNELDEKKILKNEVQRMRAEIDHLKEEMRNKDERIRTMEEAINELTKKPSLKRPYPSI